MIYCPPLLCTRIDELDTFSETAIGAGVLLHCFCRLSALADCFHHLSKMNELIADYEVVLIQRKAGDIALCHFQITGALCLGAR